VEPRRKPIVHYPTRSLDQPLPNIEELIEHGQITFGIIRPAGCVAVAHDGRQTVSMLVRRDGETVAQLLTRLDLAIAAARAEGVRVDEVNARPFPK
jgi:hypothetical protein